MKLGAAQDNGVLSPFVCVLVLPDLFSIFIEEANFYHTTIGNFIGNDDIIASDFSAGQFQIGFHIMAAFTKALC